MTKFRIRKRVLPLILAFLTVFMAAFTPYHSVEVEAADIGITYAVVDTSYEVLQWLLMMMGIGGFLAPNVGVKEDEKGRVVDEFCKEFFCDTWDQWCDQNDIDPGAFKDEFIDVLNQDYDAAKYVAGDIKSSVLNTVYKYLVDTSSGFLGVYSSDLSSSVVGSKPGDIIPSASFSGSFVYGYSTEKLTDQKFDGATIVSCDSSVYLMGILASRGDYSLATMRICSLKPFSIKLSSGSVVSAKKLRNGMYALGCGAMQYINVTVKSFSIDWNVAHFCISKSQVKAVKDSSLFDSWDYYYLDVIHNYLLNDYIANVDVPNVAGKDYSFDLVGWPNTWDIDKPNELPWDGVDSLPIPGDIAIEDSFPGVVDLPGIETGVIDGSIPWPDVIQMIKDIDTTPDPEPDPDPDKPDEDIELPAILPDGVNDKLNELKKKFPFCIPFDLVNCVKSVGSSNATPPKFTLDVPIPTTDKTYTFTVDLEMFSPYIGVFKAGIFAIFLIGLMLSTRKLIAWQID